MSKPKRKVRQNGDKWEVLEKHGSQWQWMASFGYEKYADQLAVEPQLVEALNPLCDEREEPPFSLNQIADVLRTSRVHRELGLAKVLDEYSEHARIALKAAGEEVGHE